MSAKSTASTSTYCSRVEKALTQDRNLQQAEYQRVQTIRESVLKISSESQKRPSNNFHRYLAHSLSQPLPPKPIYSPPIFPTPSEGFLPFSQKKINNVFKQPSTPPEYANSHWKSSSQIYQEIKAKQFSREPKRNLDNNWKSFKDIGTKADLNHKQKLPHSNFKSYYGNKDLEVYKSNLNPLEAKAIVVQKSNLFKQPLQKHNSKPTKFQETRYMANSLNKIFETENTSSFNPWKIRFDEKNFDNVSVTTEDFLKIVENKVESNKAIDRGKKWRQELVPHRNCGRLGNYSKLSQESASNLIGKRKERGSRYHFGIDKPARYNLTEDHVKRLARYWRIDARHLKSTIQKVMCGESLSDPYLEDDDSVIGASQSPIKSRYTRIQF